MLPFFVPFSSKIKTADIFKILLVKYFGKGSLFLKIWQRVNYCWSYGPSNLPFHFFRYRVGHLNNRQTKIAETSTINLFKPTPKQVFVESFKLLTVLYVFKKLNRNHILMANLSKLHKYQTFGLTELHNLSEG